MSSLQKIIRFRRLSLESLIAAVLALILSALVLAPILAIIIGSTTNGDEFDIRFLSNIISSHKIIINTLFVAFSVTVISLALGAFLALILVRTNIPGRRLLEQLVILPLYVTPLLTAIAWSWLGSPKSGLLNLVATQLLDFPSGLFNLHSPGGVVFVAALAYTPLPFLLIASALRAMDPSLEESARIHGATLSKSFARVTLPLVLPAILGSAVLVFVQTVGLFSVPAVLGMPSGFYVAGTEIYRLLNNYPPRVSQAAAWGVLLLCITAALVWLQTRILDRRSFVTVTGKAFRPSLVSLGAGRYALAALAWLYIILSVFLPVMALFWAATINFVTVDPKLMAFDLSHFAYVLFTYPKTYIATQNSLILGVATATLVSLLAIGIGWVTVRTRGLMRGFVDQVSMMPIAIPSMVLAIGVLWIYVNLHAVPIYGTLFILLIAYATHYLPFGVRAVSSALRQVHPDLEDAARTSGAGLAVTLRLIILPLMRPSIIAAWTLIFILSIQEVSSSVLLYTSRTTVLSVAVFDLWEAGNINALAALSIMQVLITFIALLFVMKARQREIAT